MFILIASLGDSGAYAITNLLLSVFKWCCLRPLGFFPWSQLLFMDLSEVGKISIGMFNSTKSELKKRPII